VRAMRPIKTGAMLLALLWLAGCGYNDSKVAHRAQHELLGMSAEDLQTCLGLPDRRLQITPSTELLTYIAASNTAGGANAPIPIFGGVYYAGGGYCHATFKLVNGAVTEVRFAGDDNELIGTDGFCAPIVAECLKHPEHYAPVRPPTLEHDSFSLPPPALSASFQIY